MDYTLDKKLQGFQLIAQEKLQATLWSIPNKKDLIIQPDLIKPLEHVCVASWIKSKGVQRIFKFEPEVTIPLQDNSQVFLIRADLATFKKVLNQIHEHESRSPTDMESGMKRFHVILVPNRYMVFETILEEEGLYGVVQLHRFNWDFLCLDNGVMSMELPQVLPNVYLKKDTSVLVSIAQSLRILNMTVGKPELTVTFGENAARVQNMIGQLGPPPSEKANSGHQSDFPLTIIVDRDQDYASCLLTPAIYSGLLLEVFKYRAGEVEIESNTNKIASQKLDIFKLPKPDKQAPSVIRLNSSKDEIYGENRFRHFSQASNLVRTQAKALGVEAESLNKMKLNEMQDYVAKKLPKLTEMKSKILRHLNVCEKIIQELAGSFQKIQGLEEDVLSNSNRKKVLTEIDDILTTEGQKFNTVRLVCLVHLSMGLSSDELSTFVRNYCNYFGHKYVHIFHNLAKAGLLPHLEEEKVGKAKLLSNLPLPKFQQTEFQANANRLKLLVSSPSTEENNESCPSYVFNGMYIPLIAQLAYFLLKAPSTDDLVQKLGAIDKILFHYSDSPEFKTLKQIQQAIKKSQLRDRFPMRKRQVFIFVIGGVTCAEIAACDLVGKLTGSKIVVGSNHIISGSDLVEAMF